jgi:hypothetical protein
LGLFEEVTEDFGQVIKRLNDKFGTAFSLFRHDEENVRRVFAGMETQARKKYGEKLSERKVQRPSAVKERMKHEMEYGLENPKRKKLIGEAEAVLTSMRGAARERSGKVDQSQVPNLEQMDVQQARGFLEGIISDLGSDSS